MLRLKYHYESQQYDTIIEEAPTYQTDPRSKSYLPQILYISWVTHRRENRTDEAEQLQKTFLEKFPGHPLGADMFFASAMTALAASDYDEAQRLLDIIEYRYPESRILPKAKQIKNRIQKTIKPSK